MTDALTEGTRTDKNCDIQPLMLIVSNICDCLNSAAFSLYSTIPRSFNRKVSLTISVTYTGLEDLLF